MQDGDRSIALRALDGDGFRLAWRVIGQRRGYCRFAPNAPVMRRLFSKMPSNTPPTS